MSYSKDCEVPGISGVNIAVLGRTSTQTNRCVQTFLPIHGDTTDGEFRIHRNVSLHHNVDHKMHSLKECKLRSNSEESRMSVDSDTPDDYVESEDEPHDGGSINGRPDRNDALLSQSTCQSQYMKKLKTGHPDDPGPSTVSYETEECRRRHSSSCYQADSSFPNVDVYEMPWSSSTADLFFYLYLHVQTVVILVLDIDSLSTARTLPADYTNILKLLDSYSSRSNKLQIILAATSDRFQAGQKTKKDRAELTNNAMRTFKLTRSKLTCQFRDLNVDRADIVIEESEDNHVLRRALEHNRTHSNGEICDAVRVVNNLIDNGKCCVSKNTFDEELHRNVRHGLSKLDNTDQVVRKLVEETKVVVVEDSSSSSSKSSSCEKTSSSKGGCNQLVWLRPEVLFEVYTQMMSAIGRNRVLVSKCEAMEALARTKEYVKAIANVDIDPLTILNLLQQLGFMISSNDGGHSQMSSFVLPLEFEAYPKDSPDMFPNSSDSFMTTPTLRLTLANHNIPNVVFQRIASRCLQNGYLPAKRGSVVLLYRDTLAFTLAKGSPFRLLISKRGPNVYVVLVNYGSQPFDLRTCDEIRRLVSQSVEEVLLKGLPRQQNGGSNGKHPQANNMVVYSIRCPETIGHLLGDQGWIEKEELENGSSGECFCSDHPERSQPHPVRSQDLLGVWFSNETAVPTDAPVRMDVQTTSEGSSPCLTPELLAKLADTLGANWQLFLVSEGVSQTRIQQIHEEEKTGMGERHRGLCEWKKLKESQCPVKVSALRDALKGFRSVGVDWDEFDKIVEEISH